MRCGRELLRVAQGQSPRLGSGGDSPELQGVEPGQVIGAAPLAQLHVRHTVGLADPIVPSDIAPEERLDDGLPQSLADCVERQG